MIFDESCFPSQQGTKTPLLNSPIPTPFFLAAAAPNTAAGPPTIRAPSPVPPTDSGEDVRTILDPVERPSTPPIQGPATPTTPEQHHSLPNSPPPRQSATHIEHRLPETETEMLGGFEDLWQCSQLLHEMDNAPRHSGRARVPNTKYYNADNVTSAWSMGIVVLAVQGKFSGFVVRGSVVSRHFVLGQCLM